MVCFLRSEGGGRVVVAGLRPTEQQCYLVTGLMPGLHALVHSDMLRSALARLRPRASFSQEARTLVSPHPGHQMSH